MVEKSANGSAILRVGGFLCALWLLWCAKIVWVIARETKSDSGFLLAELLLIIFFVLCVESLVRDLPARYEVHVVFLILCGLIVYSTAFATLLHAPAGTDETYFSAAGAERLLNGVNPYGLDLSVGNSPPIAATLPARMQTHFPNGSIETSLPYPALSVLLFVPAVLFQINVTWVTLIGFIAAVIVISVLAPRRFRTVAPLLFLMNPALLEYSVGGVEDILFVVPLLIAAFAWTELRIFAALALGLACAVKQIPWLGVPVFIAGILSTTDGPWRIKLKTVSACGAAIVAAFAVPNLYFAVTKPQAWLSGVLRPFTARYDEAGLGVVSFNMLHPGLIPREAMTVVAAVLFVLALIVGYRYFRVLRNALWLIPGMALLFAPRSLENYFIYLIPVCAASWFGSLPEAVEWKEAIRERWQTRRALRMFAQ